MGYIGPRLAGAADIKIRTISADKIAGTTTGLIGTAAFTVNDLTFVNFTATAHAQVKRIMLIGSGLPVDLEQTFIDIGIDGQRFIWVVFAVDAITINKAVFIQRDRRRRGIVIHHLYPFAATARHPQG